MALNFAAAVDAWTKKSTARCEAVLRESTQRLIEEANTVGPSVNAPSGGAGGKMPVDTGFLRASMAVSFDGMPIGPSRGDGKAVAYEDSSIVVKLIGVKLGKTVYAGWTAEYAIYMEERYGFMRSAAQNWQPIVTQVITEAKERFPVSAYDSGIYDAFAALVNGYATTAGLTVGWPGITFTPPASGEWLEVLWFPNKTLNLSLGNDGSQHVGFGQVSCCTRPGAGIEPVMLRAEAIIALFAKGTTLGVARVNSKPYMSTILNAGDRVAAPVTVPYSTGALAN